MDDYTQTIFYKKCLEISRRLKLDLVTVLAVFDVYDEVSGEWAKRQYIINRIERGL